jgi:hypothetical protein
MNNDEREALYTAMMADGHTYREFEYAAFPDVKKWDDDHDKTLGQPPLPGFTRCRDCTGTGFIPCGPAPGLTGLDCKDCSGKGIVPELTS